LLLALERQLLVALAQLDAGDFAPLRGQAGKQRRAVDLGL
jgi:hypothetical protein